MESTRRQVVGGCFALAAWPEILSALAHTEKARTSPTRHFETLEPAMAEGIEAIAAQIIPSSDGPGAREAGVIFFIDRALSTFAADDKEAYREGMADVEQKRQQLFPGSTSIASLSNDQQLALIRSVETSDFFELLRTHTVLGFLGNPSYGGNREKVGWKQIGFEDAMGFQHPFGYYDAPGKGAGQ